MEQSLADRTFGASRQNADNSILDDDPDRFLDNSLNGLTEQVGPIGEDTENEISMVNNSNQGFSMTENVTAFFGQKDDEDDDLIKDPKQDSKEQVQNSHNDYQDSIEADEGSDLESDPEDSFKPKDKSQQEYIQELFPYIILSRLEISENDVNGHIKTLSEIYVTHFKTLNESIKPKNKKEIKSYEKKIEKLMNKKKDHYEFSKLEFYQTKLDSLKKLLKELEKDWLLIANEIKKIIENSSKVDYINMDEIAKNFDKRLAIATSRIENRLPIYSKKTQILYSLEHEKVTVIKGKPGCGKSTQIPIMLFEKDLVSPKKKMFMITPRQVAAFQIYRRVAQEMQEDYTSEKNSTLSCCMLTGSLYKFKTDCSLVFSTDVEFYRRLVITKEIKPEEIEYLIIDETNSKKMYTEMIISVSKRLMKKYNIKVVFLCTNFNTDAMNSYFKIGPKDLFVSDRNIVEIDEKNFHTEIVYLPHNGDCESQLTEVLHQIEDRIYRSYKKNQCIKDANILVFLSGAEEVRSIYRKFLWVDGQSGLISSRLNELNGKLKTSYKLLMACGSNNVTFDEELFKDNDCQESIKLIFSTKVLETSLTIPHLGFVVDFGNECIYTWNFSAGVQKKEHKKICQDTAGQREGRTGRTAKGVCFRMYKEEDFEIMELHAESELTYKNIDILIMSLVKLICNHRKEAKEIEFFEVLDRSIVITNVHSKKFINELASEILRFDLVTRLKEDSVIWTLDLLYKLDLISEDSGKSESIDINSLQSFNGILGLGTEPKFGKAILEAYKKLKILQRKDPDTPHSILADVIDVVATNSFNRKIPFDKTACSSPLFEEATKLSQRYGDFAFNYHILRKTSQKDDSLNPKDLGLHAGSLRKFRDVQFQIRAKARGLFKLGENYFKNLDKFRGVNDTEKTYSDIVECLMKGYIVDISKFINNDLGYYHIRIKKTVRLGLDTAFFKLLESDPASLANERYMVLADVIEKDTVLEGKFNFRVPLNVLKDSYEKQLTYLENDLNLDEIASKIYERNDLPSVIIDIANFRAYYVHQILGKDGHVVDISQKNLTFKVAIKPNCFDKLSRKLDRLLDFIRRSYTNYTYELGLKDCRVNVGNGLALQEIMTSKEGVSTYFFMVPRFVKLVEGKYVVLEKPDGTIDPWDFLVEESNSYFGIDKIDGLIHYDTTYSKVNYGPDSPFMNLKFVCSSTKTNERLRERMRTMIKLWEQAGYPFQPELKFCDRHLNRDVFCKPIQLRLFFSLTAGKGKITLKAKDPTSFAALDAHMEKIRESPGQSVFGHNFEMKVNKDKRAAIDRSIELTNVLPSLDEMIVHKYFAGLGEYQLREKISVEVAKADLEKEVSRESLEKDVRRVINEILKNEVRDESLVDQFNIFVSHRLEKGYRNVKSCEIRVISQTVADAIIKYLNGRHYEIHAQPCYRIGKQYTHVIEFDEPEFHVKKRLFLKIKHMLENINLNVEETLAKDNRLQGNQLVESIKKKKPTIFWDEEKLNAIQDEENVKVLLKKSAEKGLADRVERLLRNYFNGKEVPIQEEYYSFFFGPRGDEFIKRLQAKTESYGSIRRVENKSMIIIQEFNTTYEEEIMKKIVQLDKETIKRYHLKLNPSEIRKKEFVHDIKMRMTKEKFGSNFECSVVTGYHGLVIIEIDPERFDSAKKELHKIMEKHFIDQSKKSRIKCAKCGHSGNLIRLLFCNHVFCTTCLQNSCVAQTTNSNLSKIEGLHQPILKCEECFEKIACCDIFKYMADKSIEQIMQIVVNQMFESNKLPCTLDYKMFKCSGCTILNKYYLRNSQKNKCYRCNTELVDNKAIIPSEANFTKKK